uniref:Uncharacterized protein n=1 Tax=Anguilla anguilla TaxID=7936 RepID=A0A0E9QND9_ANGAN
MSVGINVYTVDYKWHYFLQYLQCARVHLACFVQLVFIFSTHAILKLKGSIPHKRSLTGQ